MLATTPEPKLCLSRAGNCESASVAPGLDHDEQTGKVSTVTSRCLSELILDFLVCPNFASKVHKSGRRNADCNEIHRDIRHFCRSCLTSSGNFHWVTHLHASFIADRRFVARQPNSKSFRPFNGSTCRHADQVRLELPCIAKVEKSLRALRISITGKEKDFSCRNSSSSCCLSESSLSAWSSDVHHDTAVARAVVVPAARVVRKDARTIRDPGSITESWAGHSQSIRPAQPRVLPAPRLQHQRSAVPEFDRAYS